LIFADRFPFRYLCSDYRIEAEAAFAGCSGEVEPSLSVLDALYEKAKELELPAVLCMEGSNRAYADNLAKKLGCQSLLLHSCHNLSTELMETKDYLSLMEDNLEVLKIALGIGN
jgi:zinc transport system substrate-binding protein